MSETLGLQSHADAAIVGRLSGWDPSHLEMLLRGRGVIGFKKSVSKKSVVLCCDDPEHKMAQKARDYGVPVLDSASVRGAIGAPLASYRRRLEALLDERKSRFGHVYKRALLHIGEPASEADLAMVEQRIGFELPEAARNLWSTMDGFVFLWFWGGNTWRGPTEGPLAWHEAIDADGAFWKKVRQTRGKKMLPIGLIDIPDLKTIFGTEWKGYLTPDIEDLPPVRLGKREVAAEDFYPQLYGFDFFSPYYQAAIWADRETKSLQVVYGQDYGADWDFAEAVPLEVYMESLLGFWGEERLLRLNAPLGATTSMSRIRGRSYMTLHPLRED